VIQQACGHEFVSFLKIGNSRGDGHVHFFSSTTYAKAGRTSYKVTVNVSGVPGYGLPASTTFEVNEPLLSNANAQIGVAASHPDGRMGLQAAGSARDGIQFQAAVDNPMVASSPGTWSFAAEVLTGSQSQFVNGDRIKSTFDGTWCLDNIYPYGGKYNTGTGVHVEYDSPGNGGWIDPSEVVWATSQGKFKTYIMYTAPGEGSVPVPLALAQWQYFVMEMSHKTYFRSFGISSQRTTQFSLCDVEPEWSLVLMNGPRDIKM